jgi:hypothetical protein
MVTDGRRSACDTTPAVWIILLLIVYLIGIADKGTYQLERCGIWRDMPGFGGIVRATDDMICGVSSA